MTNLLETSVGIICQQVNCQNVMGAGLAKAIYEQYPKVKEYYHRAFETHSKEELFGKIQLIPITNTLSVANLFTQFSYGNGPKRGEIYTDYAKLCKALKRLSEQHPEDNIYIPKGIGCGHDGGSWEVLEPMIKALCLPNVIIIDKENDKER